MGIKEEDLIKFLDAYMSGDGYSIKPQVDENGEISFFTARENAVSAAVKENLASFEDAFGEKQEREAETFADESEQECPTCASIPNMSEENWDEEFWDDEW